MSQELRYQIEIIGPDHDLESFDCGEQSLNDYLRLHALENTSRKLGVTYVALPETNGRVIAYYTLSSAQIDRETIPNRLSRSLPRYPVPAIRIGRLAADLSTRGTGIGGSMLVDALYRSLAISESIGAYLVIVDALNEGARSFYERFGFDTFLDNPLQLFMTMKKIRGL
jgi:predicted GNAT family N-acyltransferase